MEPPSRTPQASCWFPSSKCWGRVHQSANDVEAACHKLMSLKQRNSDPSDTGSESSTASHVATVGPAGTQHTGSSIEHSRAGAKRTLDGLLARRTWEEAWDALGKGTASFLKKEHPVQGMERAFSSQVRVYGSCPEAARLSAWESCKATQNLLFQSPQLYLWILTCFLFFKL